MGNKIKVSDYIVKFLENFGVVHIFLISGGGNIHLIDSIGKGKKIKYVCNHHEQACSMAAEAYSRVTGSIGVCVVTTGPGGTNAITGVYGAWTDSIPMLVISGQIRRETMGAGKGGLRQLGDQEINIVDIVKPITKYAVTVMDPYEIGYHLEKALYLAKTGRPGPVWLDIPLDVQGAYLDVDKMKKFDRSEVQKTYDTNKDLLKKLVSQALKRLKNSQRPVLLVGNGVRLSNAATEILELIKLAKIPVITSFAGYDLVGNDNKYFYGRMGTLGQRAGNFIIQNSDFLLSIGSRLAIRTIGYQIQSFARKAYKIVVDIDNKELKKKTIKPDISVNYDAKEFIVEMIRQLREKKFNIKIKEWFYYVEKINKKYPNVPREIWKEKKYVNPYCFVDTLSKYLKPKGILAVSDGTALICTYQALKFKQGVRVVLNSGSAPMGYGLPAAIGASFANNKKEVICLEGDGSIQLNVQELQTIVHHKLPIKIFVYNNEGYVSIRMTQNNLFGGKLVASDPTSGLTCPDIIKIAEAYGIKTKKISNHSKMDEKIRKILATPGPLLCEVKLNPSMEFIPKAAARKLSDGSLVSGPLEEMYPFLSEKELKESMIIPLWGDKQK